MHAGRCDAQRNQGDHHQADVAQQAGQANRSAPHVELDAGLPEPAHQHQRNHCAQQPEIDGTIKAEASGIGGGVYPHHAFLAVGPGVHGVKQRQQAADHEQGFGPDVLQGPEKTDPFEEAEEERRVAQRGQRATDVGHNKNEEHKHMGAVLTVVVGADQGAQQQHRRTCGAHHAGQHSPYGQDGSIEPRAAVQIAPDVNTPGHGEQGRQQHDEGDVFGHQCVGEPRTCGCRAKGQCKRHQEQQPPGGGHLAEMVVPEDRHQQGHQCNRQQDARKRYGPGNGQGAAIHVGRHRQAGCQQQGCQRRQTGCNLHVSPFQFQQCMPGRQASPVHLSGRR